MNFKDFIGTLIMYLMYIALTVISSFLFNVPIIAQLSFMALFISCHNRVLIEKNEKNPVT